MPIIELADSPLGYAGQAAAAATAGMQQDQRTALQRAALLQREEEQRVNAALDRETMLQRRQKELQAHLENVSRDWSRGLELASSAGVPFDDASLRRLDTELRDRNPQMWEQVNSLFPIEEGMSQEDFSLTFGKRAEAVVTLRDLESRQTSAELFSEFQLQADELGATPEEREAVRKAYDAGGSADAVRSTIDAVHQAAEERIGRQMALEHGQQLLKAHSDKLLPLISGPNADPRVRAAVGRLRAGTSKEPEADIWEVETAALGRSVLLDRDRANHVQLGRELERKRQAEAAARRAPVAPGPAGVADATQGEGVRYEEEGAPLAPGSSLPPADPVGPGTVSRAKAPVVSKTFAPPPLSAELQPIQAFFKQEGVGPKSSPAEVKRAMETFLGRELEAMGINTTGKRTAEFYSQVFERYRTSQDPQHRSVAAAAAYLKNQR